MNIRTEILRIVSQSVPNERISVCENSRFSDIGLDSITLVELIATVEDEFGICFTEEELLGVYEWETVCEFIDIVQTKAESSK